ncbi:MAG: His-Xaa-Ser system radical SAM maturase HxsB [Patescibacteria group bacterium]|nr:His-Xaa-Ser system radical SAM maturase HxsB [Patescibacteria group bacterium]
MASVFKDLADFLPNGSDYTLLPFRFIRLDKDRYVAVNEAGEWQVLNRPDLEAFIKKKLPREHPLYSALAAKHFVLDASTTVGTDLLALKVRTKRQRIAEFTSLHMFVVTLRCNHSCQYCQVSRQSEDRSSFDMTLPIADKAIEFMFRSPAKSIKVEFQGGESLLNFELIKHIVLEVKRRNLEQKRSIAFVIATNLSVLNDGILNFCRDHDICISTSLDGPEDLHNANRPAGGNNSYRMTIDGIRRTRNAIGTEKVSALMTTTMASLPRVKEIIDEYVRQGFSGIFLRRISPYGFAMKSKSFESYAGCEWQEFYRKGLDYIIELNKNGTFMVEQYAAMILQKMLTPYGTGFVNLQSPAGIGIAGIIYNYNGDVYPSDEARMKAEMGDTVFRMGNLLSDSYEQVMLSPALLNPLIESVAEAVPMCDECAFLPYCGSDPDYHYATQRDFVGHKALSGFCEKNMGVFKYLIQKMEDEPETQKIFEGWLRW